MILYAFLFMSLGAHKHTSLLGLYLRVKLLDQIVFKYSTLIQNTKGQADFQNVVPIYTLISNVFRSGFLLFYMVLKESLESLV